MQSILEDQLEQLMEVSDLVCNSRDREHSCTVKAVAMCRSMCDDVIRFWCQARVDHYKTHVRDYHRVCAACGDPVQMDWRVIPI